MRTLTGSTATGAVAVSTLPCLLLELGFASILRFSSRDDVVFGGNTYLDNSVSVSGMSVTIGDMAAAYTAIFRSEIPTGITCKLWLAFGEGPFTTEPELLFSGQVGGADLANDQITIQMVTRWARKIPYRFAEPPLFNFIPAEGTEILTPSGIVVLERG